MLETILYYASMWAPALVSILGIAASVIYAIGRVIKAIQDWQTDAKTSKETADTLHADMSKLITQNRNLQAYNQKLLENITKIAGYDITVEDGTNEEK